MSNILPVLTNILILMKLIFNQFFPIILKRNLLLILSFLFFPLKSVVFGQILNVEKFQSKVADSISLYNEIGFNATITQNQTTLYDLNTKTFHILNKNDFKFMLINNLRLVILENENVISKGYVHFRATHKSSKRLQTELFFQEQYDAIRELNRRDVQGADLRINLFDGNNSSLALAIGLMHEFEWWKTATISEKTRFIKSTNSLLLSLKLTDNLIINSTAYYQFAPTRVKTPRIIADSRLSWKINETFRIGLSNNFLYDAAPIIPIDKSISETSIDLILSF